MKVSEATVKYKGSASAVAVRFLSHVLILLHMHFTATSHALGLYLTITSSTQLHIYLTVVSLHTIASLNFIFTTISQQLYSNITCFSYILQCYFIKLHGNFT